MNSALMAAIELLDVRVQLASAQIARWRVDNADRIAAARTEAEATALVAEALRPLLAALDAVERLGSGREH